MLRIIPVLVLLPLIMPMSAAQAATDAELGARIVGAWGQDGACLSGRLTFEADGTFTLTQGARTETGHWTIRDGALTGGSDDGSSRPRMLVEFDDGALVLSDVDQRQVLRPCAGDPTPD